jgi:hypothetical protein
MSYVNVMEKFPSQLSYSEAFGSWNRHGFITLLSFDGNHTVVMHSFTLNSGF